MGMNGTYYRAHLENMKLRKNKARYKRLKDNAFEKIERKLKLQFVEPSSSKLKEIRKQVFNDMRRERRRRRVLSIFSLLSGLIVAAWVIYLFQHKIM